MDPLPDRAGDVAAGGDSWTPEDAPFESDEAAKGAATSPGFDKHTERTDSAGGQFQGETNAGRVLESLVSGPSELRRHCATGVSAHGKGIGDAISRTPAVNLQKGASGFLVRIVNINLY